MASVRGWAARIIPLLNLILFGFLFYLIGSRNLEPSTGWNAADLVTVILTAVTIVVAALGIIVAVAAVIGYQALSDLAKRKAAETSEDVAKAFLGSKPFREQVDTVVAEQMRTYNKSEAIYRLVAEPEVADGGNENGGGGDTAWRD